MLCRLLDSDTIVGRYRGHVITRRNRFDLVKRNARFDKIDIVFAVDDLTAHCKNRRNDLLVFPENANATHRT